VNKSNLLAAKTRDYIHQSSNSNARRPFFAAGLDAIFAAALFGAACVSSGLDAILGLGFPTARWVGSLAGVPVGFFVASLGKDGL